MRTFHATIICIVCSLFAGSLFAAEIQRMPILFYHENAEEPQLTQLREEFDFASYVSAGRNEMEEMSLLKNWVYRHIPYGLNFGDSDLRDSRAILRRARNGDEFLCTSIATVYLQCAVSMGWTARLVFLRRPGGAEHAGNDIWSNQHRKWIYIDPTWNIHLERRGVPLGILEIRREWKKNRGRDLVYVFGAGKNEHRYRARDLPVRRKDSRIWKLLPLDRNWTSYADKITVLGRNDFFSSAAAVKTAGEPVYEMARKASWRKRLRTFFFSGTGYSPESLFHDLNRVDVFIEGDGENPGSTLRVRLDASGENSYAPNFMEYLVKINNRDWEIAGERLEFIPGQGENIVRARIMNRLGVVGPVTEKRFVAGSGIIKKNLSGAKRNTDYNRGNALNN